MITSKFAGATSLMVVALTLVGCGDTGDRPPLGTVSGRITMDGQPLSGAIVMFKPDSGRPGSGETDFDGNYTLEYQYRVPGTKVGPNTVSLAAPMGGEVSHPIPDKYSSKSELKVDVKKGSNKFDFDLTSK